MVLPVNGSTHLIPAYYSFYRPRKDERLSWLSWLTYSGWLTHISGHPSAAGRAQDRECSPARDRRSTTVPRHCATPRVGLSVEMSDIGVDRRRSHCTAHCTRIGPVVDGRRDLSRLHITVTTDTPRGVNQTTPKETTIGLWAVSTTAMAIDHTRSPPDLQMYDTYPL